MKRTRIVALVSTLCICLAIFATGVWAIASTVLFSLNGNLKYYPEGVYVELSGQVYRGDSLDTLEPITSNSRFTLEKQTNFDDTDGEPSGNFPIKTWYIGSLPFAPQLRFIKIEVNVTNYSDFDIQGTAQNTIDGTNLEITDNVYNLACIVPKETITYELLLELTGTTEIEKTIEVNFDFEKFVAQDASQYSTLTFTSNGDRTAQVKANSSNKPTGDLVIPKKVSIDGVIHSVTSIGSYAFRNCSGLTSIEIPSSVTSIGDSAFYGCSSLTSIEIPSSVTSIGSAAFMGCSSLTSIKIPSGVTSIGSLAFSGCSSLTSIEIPNSVTSIGNTAFSGCSSLTSIEIPSSVTSIGPAAFMSCSSLTSIKIPSGVTSIGSLAFHSCSGLKYIHLSGNLTSPYSLSGTWQYSATELTTPTFSTTTSSMQSAGWYYQKSAWNA
ncbi:MAG TPA: leucine-rich repeat domain-containing protein [Candidatus Caccopulliclostridium gallistercoris]|uniref:Leucine-rich repeat domain-containing protein n=1 Tax=Candidatus Caccopulliclostridium gallistercoris TaxID=2840719 RepID=A0A9D1SYJ1_9FIRM|nr:leucine-rich repeat domain-containing protein [Candidatus Caccopulliclostridium gallistercoris]